jgi:hypothetical protein
MDIVTIGDLHTGSAYAPFPKGFTNSWGSVVQLNVGQRYLLRCWRDFISRIPARFDALLLLGDLIHGQNRKESAAELCEVDPEWQQRAALELLSPIAERAKEVYGVRGSGYHVGETGRWEEQLVRQLGALPDKYARYARSWLHLDFDGVLLDVAHRQSGAMVNRAMPLEREGRYALMRSQADGQPAPDLVIRAHTHQYRWIDIDGQPLALGTPAWKMPSAYEETSITPNRIRSATLGAVVLRIRPKRKRKTRWRGEYISHKYLCYVMPQLEVARYGAPGT